MLSHPLSPHQPAVRLNCLDAHTLASPLFITWLQSAGMLPMLQPGAHAFQRQRT